jgi:membrane associated rhomboid family serine protease
VLPLADVVPTRTTPWMTFAIMSAIVLVFGCELLLDDQALVDLMFGAGFLPDAPSWPDALTALFVHADWLRALGNLVALWVFGRTVEDRMGHGRFLVFFLMTGVAGALVEVWLAPQGTAPVLGAGCAVAGVLAAYLALFPFSRVQMLVFLVTKIDIVEIPAAFVGAVWLLSQLAGGAGYVTDVPVDRLAIWSIMGGAASGLLAVWVFRRRERLLVEWWS